MGKIEKFEDIRAWQIARELVKKIYSLTRKGEFSRDYGLRDQIRKAAVSSMSNVAEGFERYTRKEFLQFLNIARGSAGEVRSQLYVASDLEYISAQELSDAKSECETLSRTIWNFMKYLRSCGKGEKAKGK